MFKLEGKNSHLADDDVFATCSLAAHCYALAQKVIPSQETFLRLPSVCRRALLVRRNILPLYRATASRLRQTQGTGDALISTEMRNMYAYLLESNLIQPVKNIEYVFKYISQEMVDPKNDYDLITQISNHILEISTLKESDLCTSKIIEERIIITTIHKAKGLEFDNVIIFDANSDRYPNFFSLGNPAAVEEDKRKLYVAMTRAKQRLVIYTGCTKFNARGDLINRVITPFLLPVKKFFVPTHVE
ncbi:MAG: ATP-binding domain-containing protein [Prevotella sp.]|nr:ATP-binding domain-containing protein [Prevotella sp.]